jgi:hypothetical protein
MTTAPTRENVYVVTPMRARIAKANHARGVDALEELAGLIGDEHRRLAALHDMLGPAHRMRRVRPDHLAGDQPIEEHAHGRQVLLTVGFEKPC